MPSPLPATRTMPRARSRAICTYTRGPGRGAELVPGGCVSRSCKTGAETTASSARSRCWTFQKILLYERAKEKLSE
jgi:hypothetical protein